MDTGYLARLASDIDEHGLAVVEPALIEVIGRVRDAGIDSVALSVVADPTQPEIARTRAFGMVAAEFDALVTEMPHARRTAATYTTG